MNQKTFVAVGNQFNIGNKLRPSLVTATFLSLLVLVQLFTVAPSHAAKVTTIKVFAASSLTAELSQLSNRYERTHHGVALSLSLSSSSSLATQIKNGAPADIFISASRIDMERALGGKISNATPYLTNRIVLAVPLMSTINKITDLNSQVTWIQCAHEVPCGVATDKGLAGEGITSSPSSLEPSLSTALAKLLSGAVDAAFVYSTDVKANSDTLKAIEFSDPARSKVTYYLATLKNSIATRNFAIYLQSASIRRSLNNAGFGKP
mgnify:FL=1